MRRERDLGGDQQLVGTQVLGAEVDDPVDVLGALQGGADGIDPLFPVAPSPISRLCISMLRITADDAEQHADADGADAVPDRVAGEHRRARPRYSARIRPTSAPSVLEQHDRQLRTARGRG